MRSNERPIVSTTLSKAVGSKKANATVPSSTIPKIFSMVFGATRAVKTHKPAREPSHIPRETEATNPETRITMALMVAHRIRQFLAAAAIARHRGNVYITNISPTVANRSAAFEARMATIWCVSF